MSNKNSWGWGNFIAIIILAGILIVGGSLLGNHVSKKQAAKQVAGIETTLQPVVEKTVSYEGENDKTALELLKAKNKIEIQESSIGVFVTSINDTPNQDNKYWMFYVDGNLASTSADQYKTKDGEKIEWRYETLQY